MTATMPPPAAEEPDRTREHATPHGPFGALGTPVADTADTRRPLDQTIQRAISHLTGLQDPAGWWKGDLETNVTMDAEDLLLRHVLGILDPQDTERAAHWIRSQQRADGTWATFGGGPGDLSTTVEAWVALRLAGDSPDAPHMRAAAEFARSKGGVAATRVFTRIWLSLVGLWSWHDVPTIPPEIVLLPRWVPLNIYDWACWARQTIVPLAVVSSLEPVYPVPFGIAELDAGPRPIPRPTGWERAFGLLDAAVKAYGRRPVRPLRAYAVRRAERWILARQEADGSWGGIQPPWVYSLIALRLLGHGPDSAAVRAGLAGLDAFMVKVDGAPWAPLPTGPDDPAQLPAAGPAPGPAAGGAVAGLPPTDPADGPVRWLEACQSPVWDTALALIALLDAGLPASDPAVRRGTDWLLGEEVRVGGDWQVRRPRLAPAGWAFEFANDGYPDVDDTAEVVLALRRAAAGHPDPARVRAAADRGAAWATGMASSDGGWGAFDADNTRELVRKLPFCDFGAVIDPPSADVTAHMVEMLAHTPGVPLDRGIDWLLRAQEEDGSWFGRWGVNHVYGTGAAVPALVAAGIPARGPVIRRAVRWLEEHQNPDGGWGEDIRSYTDPRWIGRGTSTASQTAWALLALVAAGALTGAAERGVEFLVRTQRADGTWDEPQFTGTGFPGDFSINYHLYRLVFPLSALGRYAEATR
jgi:squalene-hopene/tetraprenyl-beta-curcumene cyclase